ncbi:MAG: NAD(P)-binding protein [Pseudobdellovibrio sp.]
MVKNRRDFLKYSALGLAGVSTASLLSSCASFDDYLFDDKNNLTDEVVIIGGGISGLYLAHLLRAKQQEFRLYEASPRLGGRIKSDAGHDYGASVFNANDQLLNQLIEELKIAKTNLDKDNYYLANGMETLVDELKSRVLGLIPYRNFRLRSPLIEIQKFSGDYELTFQMENGQKRVRCKKIALSLPPSQWGRVKGLLDLPEMEMAKTLMPNLVTQNIIRLLLPTTAFPANLKTNSSMAFDNFDTSTLYKKTLGNLPVEFDIKYLSNINFSIDYVYGEIKKKLQVNYPFQKLSTEQFYSWQQTPFIQGALFKFDLNLKQDPQSIFQLIGDSVSAVEPNRIEGALQSAQKAMAAFIS